MILTENEYNELMSKIISYFSKKKIDVIFRDKYTIELPKGEYKERVISTRNLLKICKVTKKEKWNKLVNDFFDIQEEAENFDEIFKEKKNDFGFMEEYIGVRFLAKGYLGGEPEKSSIFLSLLEDVYLTLIFDFPRYTKNILLEHLEKWNKSAKELFKIGFSNIENKYRFTVKKQIVQNILFHKVITQHFFGNMVLFDLEERNLVGTFGSLIIVPNRHVTFIYPIESCEVEKAVKVLIYIADVEFNEPGSLSYNLYWFKDQNFTLQRIEKIGKDFVLNPTDDFSNMLTNVRLTE